MESQKERRIISHPPVCTLFILFLSIVTFSFPEASSFFIFDRTAILNGEIWRLLTGHLVHFNRTHIVYNFMAFGLVGWMIESNKHRHYFLFLTFIALSISLTLLLVKTGMTYYGGLSGLASGWLVYLALLGLQDTKPWRILCWSVLFILPIKIFFERITGESVLPYWNGPSFITIWEAHAIGSLTALTIFVAQKIIEKNPQKAKGWRNKSLITRFIKI